MHLSTSAINLCLLLDVAFLDSFFVQVLYELLPLHPVDEWADVTAVAEKRPASQVQNTSCKDRRWHTVMLDCPAGLLKVFVWMYMAQKISYHIISYLCLKVSEINSNFVGDVHSQVFVMCASYTPMLAHTRACTHIRTRTYPTKFYSKVVAWEKMWARHSTNLGWCTAV